MQVHSGRDLPDTRPEHAGGEPPDGAERGAQGGRTVLSLERQHLLRRDVRPGDEALQVHLDHVALADIVQNEAPEVRDRRAPGEQSHGRDADALLVTLARVGREAARRQPAHVDHVTRRARPPDARGAAEDRPHDDHVLQVEATAVVRVVGQEHVARRDAVEARAHDGDRVGRVARLAHHR